MSEKENLADMTIVERRLEVQDCHELLGGWSGGCTFDTVVLDKLLAAFRDTDSAAAALRGYHNGRAEASTVPCPECGPLPAIARCPCPICDDTMCISIIKDTALKIAKAAEAKAVEVEKSHGWYNVDAAALDAFADFVRSRNWEADDE